MVNKSDLAGRQQKSHQWLVSTICAGLLGWLDDARRRWPDCIDAIDSAELV